MYKDGKKWVFAGLTTFSLGLGILGTPIVIKADQVTQPNPTKTQSAKSVVNDSISENSQKVVKPELSQSTVETEARSTDDNTQVVKDDQVATDPDGSVAVKTPTTIVSETDNGPIQVTDTSDVSVNQEGKSENLQVVNEDTSDEKKFSQNSDEVTNQKNSVIAENQIDRKAVDQSPTISNTNSKIDQKKVANSEPQT